MEYYVTLFDSHYLTRGLCLYESILKHSQSDFRLVVIVMDNECSDILRNLDLDKMIVVTLEEFEDAELLSIKAERSRAEYCWSSTAKSIIYVFDHFNVDECTYIDSDIMFFDDPQIIINDIPKDKSVMITEHRYTPEYDQTETSGKYCVQFMFFRNDPNGLKTLYWWKDRCIEWCGAETTCGRMGDQMYLDDWMDRFDGIYEMQNYGGGIAPWNVQQYSFYEKDNHLKYHLIDSNMDDKVIFYHFHAIEFFNKNVVRLCPAYYGLPDTAISYIYKHYIRMIEYVKKKYNLSKGTYSNEDVFRDDVNYLCHDKNFYNYSLFI